MDKVAYKVAYRKYRPEKFADVVGQPQVTVTLKNELKSGRISHAYLFTGTRGTGKTTCAKILSKAVNCLNLQDGDPCGECEVCRGLEDGSIMDVMEIDAASNNGIENIRSLIEESNFTPTKAKYRVYIIDEVHMLSTQAFNALLKTLEEPPTHVIFILATTEVHKLLPTILSRCQRFDFKHIAPEEIAARVEYVAGEENAKIDSDAAMLIARLADGALRDALSILDQCLGRSEHITLDVVSEATGIAGREYLAALADAVVQGDVSKAISGINELHEKSKDMSRLCEELAEYFRGLMLIRTMENPGALVVASATEMEIMRKQAFAISLSDIIHSLDTFEVALSKMRFSNPRAVLEMSFVRLCSPELDSSNDALIRRIEKLEKGQPAKMNTIPVIVAAEPKPEIKAEIKEIPKKQEEIPQSVEPAENMEPPVEEPPVEEPMEFVVEQAPEKEPELAGQTAFEGVAPPRRQNGALDIEELSKNAEPLTSWPEILDIMREYSSSIAAAFSGSSKAYINGGYMLIDAPQMALDLLKRESQRGRLRDATERVTGRVYQLGPYKRGDEVKETDELDTLEEKARRAGIPITLLEREENEEEE